MWCKHCRQDVPAISSTTSGCLGCAQCGQPIAGATSEAAALADAAAHGVDLGARGSSTPSTANYDDWELDQNVRRVQARAGARRRVDRPHSERRAAERRFHSAHANLPPRHKRKQRSAARSSLAAWSSMSLGLMALACGTALLIWSFVTRRDELWSLGMPIAVAGQVGLLVGLVLQLERIWQNSRYSAHKLDQVDAQLHQLERTTSMLGVTHGTAAQAFYNHMAADANPHLLLADLKGQLDMLTQELGRRL